MEPTKYSGGWMVVVKLGSVETTWMVGNMCWAVKMSRLARWYW